MNCGVRNPYLSVSIRRLGLLRLIPTAEIRFNPAGGQFRGDCGGRRALRSSFAIAVKEPPPDQRKTRPNEQYRPRRGRGGERLSRYSQRLARVQKPRPGADLPSAVVIAETLFTQHRPRERVEGKLGGGEERPSALLHNGKGDYGRKPVVAPLAILASLRIRRR